MRRDGAGVEWTRTRGQSVGDGGALAVCSARQEQHDGARASPAGAAVRVPGGGRLASPPALPLGPSLAPWLCDAQEPAHGDNRQLLPDGSFVVRSQFHSHPRQRVRQPSSSTDSGPARDQDSNKKGSRMHQFLGKKDYVFSSSKCNTWDVIF